MSGYLEVKNPFKSNIGLNPFKTWKRQWCILRPSPTRAGGGSLAVYCSEAGAPAGSVELPPKGSVRRANSRTRPHAFAVFSPGDSRKPRILLAATSSHEAQVWIDKIREVLSGSKLLGTENLLKDSYLVTILSTELSHKCGMSNVDGVLGLTSRGLVISQHAQGTPGMLVPWRHVSDVMLNNKENKNKLCVVIVDSKFTHGAGVLKLSTPSAGELVSALKQTLKNDVTAFNPLSRSEGDLRSPGQQARSDRRDPRCTSWYSGPSEISLDDTDLVMAKEWRAIPSGPLSRCAAAELSPVGGATRALLRAVDDSKLFHSMADRRSLASIASGIYEEIPDLPACSDQDCVDGQLLAPSQPANQHTKERSSSISSLSGAVTSQQEPTYESVSECVYATMRRARRQPPPPLPPRVPFQPSKVGDGWGARALADDPSLVSRHSSLGSIPRCCSSSSGTSSRSDGYRTKTLPKTKQAFSVFRKRLKSDTALASPKSDAKENKDVETKKKKFDFAPTRDIFKSFKVGRKMKHLKLNATNLSKIGETKSCEYLDETEHVTASRCSKSVECLEHSAEESNDSDNADLSIEFSDEAIASLSLPQDLIDLFLRGRDKLAEIRIKHKQLAENEYMPMSPIVPPPPIEHHYMVMSPRTNLA